MSLHYLNYWKKQTSAGRSASSLSLSGFSTSVVFNSRLSYSKWDFVHRSRSYTLQVRCSFQKVVVCRRCRGYNETLAHVVSHCDTLQAYINARHDTVVDILKTEIQEYCNAELYVNVTCRFVYSTLRVDLQVFFPDRKRIVLIDVKCPFDEKENLDNSNRGNLAKYKPLRDAIKDKYGDHIVLLYTFVEGALGTWIPANSKPLDAVFLSGREKAIAIAIV